MKDYLSLVKFAHTIFAMPFALLGLVLGLVDAEIGSRWWILLLQVLACMVFARNAAMAFNRYVDWRQDLQNPRTVMREIPQGIVSPKRALAFTVVNGFLFILTTYFINTLCFFLSPIALLIILGYSYTKRFTFLCHLILGLGLGLAPVGAYLAVTAQFSQIPLLLGGAVVFWVAGFDMIYSLQDESFDRAHGLRSIPVLLGGSKALQLSAVLHALCAVLIASALWSSNIRYPSLQFLHWLAGVAFIALLFYQHTLVKPHDLSRVNLAFFTTNGIASLLFASMIILDLLLV